MTRNLFTAGLAAAIAMASLAPATAEAADLREHRAVYTTPYLGNWPTGPIMANNAEAHRRFLCAKLDDFKASNVNVIYYHVRSNCDAAYESAYEPWSKNVAPERGTAPAFDPFGFLLDECHKRGIEVYAWVNPYRYCGVYTHGQNGGDLNYENSHPEWLISQPGKETILNPALEEVKQRICDVIKDIMVKYDVDGIIFDDYFYSNPTPYELDADDYAAAKAKDPTIGSQLEWRVNNINELIGRVYRLIKEVKPYCVFGISPAGQASPPDIRDYGLEPLDGDWQYEAIASDPIDWYAHGHVDFMAPQIYWPNRFDGIQDWWVLAARKFRRHLYSAISLSNYSTYKGAEYNREVEYSRSVLPENENGVGFFSFGTYINSKEKFDGVLMNFGNYLGTAAYKRPALTPLRFWHNVYAPAYIENLHRDGNRLVWNEVPGMRYTVYAFEAGKTPEAIGEYFRQVSYVPSYEINEADAGKTFGVCVYDRYGNEYPMLVEGATLSEGIPTRLVYPEDASPAADLFDFVWEDNGADNILEVATDAEFKDIVTMVPVHGSSISCYSVPEMEAGKTYYWRVRTHAANHKATLSETRSFVASRVAVTGPEVAADMAPVITWTPAYEGTSYLLEISRNRLFSTIELSETVNEASYAVPDDALVSGYNYYVRVTATRKGISSVSDVARMQTPDINHPAPAFVNPASQGATVHANEGITVTPLRNIHSITIQIAETDKFPARQSYKATLRGGEASTPELSTIKVASKALVDGQTYYVRTCSNYFTSASSSHTEASEYNVSSFVYSSTNGISDVIGDGSAVEISAEGILSLPSVGNNVAVYTASGAMVFSHVRAGTTVDLSALPAGLYMIQVQGPDATNLKWIKK